MNSLQSVVRSLPGYIVYFAAVLLAAAQLAVLLRVIREKEHGIRILAAALHFLLGIFFLSLLLDYSYNALIDGHPEILYQFEWKLFSLPWLLYAVLELISALVIFIYERTSRRYRMTRLTSDSIRQVF